MKCPGQDWRYWTGELASEVPCPECGALVELFRDESFGRCRRCGHRFSNPGADFGCAQWCSLAKECLGFAPPRGVEPEFRETALAARLLQAVAEQCRDQPARIARALRVFRYAKELLRKEGGDPRLVLSAALALQSDGPAQDSADSSPAGPTQAAAELARARQLFARVELDGELSRRACEIMMAYRTGNELDTVEFRIVRDADKLGSFAAEDCGSQPDPSQEDRRP